MGVLIAVPHTGTIRTSLAERLIDLESRDEVELYFSSKRPVDVNRCHIANYFLDETDHEYLLMVDSDVLPPENVLELQEYDAGVVSPLIFSMRDGVPYPVGAVENEDGNFTMYAGEDHGEEDVVDLAGVGTACMLVKREVFEALDEPYFEFVKEPDGSVNTGEDFDFCRRVGEAGFDIKMVLDKDASHYSTIDLARFMRLLRLAAEEDGDKLQ